MTISLLIPVHNYDIVALVCSMRSCLFNIPEFTEILIGVDGSTTENITKYRSLEGKGVRIIVSEMNIGRAAIRNKLALEATGDFLLFIDADAMLPGTAEAYIQKWIPVMNHSRVTCGGILYRESPPGDPDKILRWKYGRKREQRKASERNKNPYASFSTFNVLIERTIFSKLRFNEEIKQYGYEDTLLSYQLRKAGIRIHHIDNCLIHDGLESNLDYLKKIKEGITNLSILYDSVTDKKTFTSSVRLLRNYKWIRFLRLRLIMAAIYIRYRERMEIRIDSADPKLWLFSLYKLSMFCTIREIHVRKINSLTI